MTKPIDAETLAALFAAPKHDNTEALSILVDLIVDQQERLEALEEIVMPKHARPPSGYIVLKAVTKYGFLPEHIRRLAQRGKVASMRCGSRWWIFEDDVRKLAEKMEV